jgi:stringent starvation protein B
MSEISTKPYLIRAIYEWCADATLTPYLTVRVDQNVRVPMEYVKNGEIVLSVSQQATRNLTIGNDLIQFSARFNGVSREISIPIYAVQGIFARENGRGVFFDPESAPIDAQHGGRDAASTHPHSVHTHPTLQAVPSIAHGVANASDHGDDSDAATGADAVSHVSHVNGREPLHAAHASDASDDAPSSVEATTETESIEKPQKPDKPKGPSRGNLRVIK